MQDGTNVPTSSMNPAYEKPALTRQDSWELVVGSMTYPSGYRVK
jgi:hypothetical protein